MFDAAPGFEIGLTTGQLDSQTAARQAGYWMVSVSVVEAVMVAVTVSVPVMLTR